MGFAAVLSVISSILGIGGAVNGAVSSSNSSSYQKSQLDIERERLGLEQDSLINEYRSTLNGFKANRLSAQGDLLSYKNQAEQTGINIRQIRSDIGSYENLIGRWQADYDLQMRTQKMQGLETFNQLMAGFTGTEVMNAEAGRGGRSAQLVEGAARRQVEMFAGKDMKFNAIGGLYGRTISELDKDLNADLASYRNQVQILGESLDMEQGNLEEYNAHVAEIEKAIEDYDADIESYEQKIRELEENRFRSDEEEPEAQSEMPAEEEPEEPEAVEEKTEEPHQVTVEELREALQNKDRPIDEAFKEDTKLDFTFETPEEKNKTTQEKIDEALANGTLNLPKVGPSPTIDALGTDNIPHFEDNSSMEFKFNPDGSSGSSDLSDITLPGMVMPGTGIDTRLDFSGVDLQISRENAESVGLIQDPEPAQTTKKDLPELPSTTPRTESGAVAVKEMTESEKAMASPSEKINIAVEEAEASQKTLTSIQQRIADALKKSIKGVIAAAAASPSSSSSSTQSESEQNEPDSEPKQRTTGGGTGGSYSSFEDRVEKESAQVETAKTSSSSSNSYSQAVQEGLDSGKYKIDENGYVVAAGSSSTPRARR